MTRIGFEWDDAKNISNRPKHGVSFEEASRVFLDPLYFSVYERIQDGEERWQTFGVVGAELVLMVAHTVREEGAEGFLRAAADCDQPACAGFAQAPGEFSRDVAGAEDAPVEVFLHDGEL